VVAVVKVEVVKVEAVKVDVSSLPRSKSRKSPGSSVPLHPYPFSTYLPTYLLYLFPLFLPFPSSFFFLGLPLQLEGGEPFQQKNKPRDHPPKSLRGPFRKVPGRGLGVGDVGIFPLHVWISAENWR
jgi:hypothetical protein